jgi:hypothetical protein
MDTRSGDNHWYEVPAELRCDSRECYRCKDDVCEERFEDLVYSIGP